MTEQELLVDCLNRLNAAGVMYMVTGSMAGNHWGIPRSTHDLDFVLQLPPSAISALTRAFSTGFYLDEQSIGESTLTPARHPWKRSTRPWERGRPAYRRIGARYFSLTG